jgi:hypothetical protein
MREAQSILVGVLFVVACGGEGGSSGGAPTPAASRPAATASAATTPTSTPTPTPAPPATPPVDLLPAIPVDVAVSSVYRNRGEQVARLVDGDLETAWNSQTGELVGAWIEVRLPASASVTGMALTVGYTQVQGENDLFTGNHRIARVKVLRDGVEVASQALDPASRELQNVAVTGAGGVYRIEVTEVAAGTRSDWREICVSELRVMGRDPNAHADSSFPRTAVGALPDPAPEPGTADRAEVARRLTRETRWFAETWARFEDSVHYYDASTGEPDPPPDEAASMARTYRTTLTRVADFVFVVDAARAGTLRMLAASNVSFLSGERREAIRKGLDAVAAGYDAVASWLAETEAQCAWARLHGNLRMHRITKEMEMREAFNLMEESPTREAAREMRGVERLNGLMPGVESLWRRDPRSAIQRFTPLTLPGGTDSQADWDAMHALITTNQARCGW